MSEKWWKSGIDNSGLRKDADEASNIVNGLSNKVKAQSAQMDSSFSTVGKGLAAIGGTAAITMIGNDILETTAKFEKFGIVLRNTLGDVEGDKALGMIADFAATTPFQLDEVTGSFIKMANQGFVPTRQELVKLGDFASVTGKSFDQLTEAVLDAQTGEFERLKEFGVKASQSGDKVTFTFRDQKTTVDKTNAAIRGYILSLGELEGVQGSNAKVSAAMTGIISNLEDKMAAAANKIGTDNKTLIYSILNGATAIVDNYEIVGKVLMGLVATYGAYRAAVLVATAVSKGYTIAQNLEFVSLLLVEKAQLAVNASMLTNPYVAAAVAVTALVAGLAIYLSTLEDVNKTEISKKTIQDKVSKQYDEQKSKIDMLVGVLNNEKVALSERKNALGELQKIIPNYHASLDNEGKLINNNKSAIDEYLKSLEKEIRLQASKDELIELYKKKRLQEKDFNKANDDKTRIDKDLKNVDSRYGGGAAIGDVSRDITDKVNKSKKELTDTVTAIKAIESELTAEISTTTAKIVAPEKNKDYWEKQKKNAQDALALMGEAKKGSKEWNEQVRLSNQATEKLKLWDTTGNVATEVNKKAQETADANLKIKNNAAKAALEQKQTEIDNQNAVIATQEDGFAKQKSIIELNHKQRLLDIDKQAQELVEKEQEAEKLAWEKNGKKGVFTPKTTDSSNLSAASKKTLSDSKLVVDITYNADNDNLLKDLSDKYASFDEKRREIDRKYSDDGVAIKAMFSGEELDVKLKELDSRHKEAIKGVNSDEADSLLKTSDLFIQLFGDASMKSVNSIRAIAAESQALFDYLNNTSVGDLTDKFGFSKEQLTSLKLSKEQMKGMKDQITTLNGTADKGELVFGEFGANIKKVFDGFGKGKKTVGETQKLMEGLQGTLQTVSAFAGQAQGLLNAMSTEEGDAASSAAKSIGAVMDVANSTMQGFQQGGVVGAAVAFTMSVATKIFEAEKAHQAALKKLQDEKIAQQKEYNDLLIKQNDLLDNAVTIYGTDAFGQALGYAQVADKYRNASKNATADLSGAKVQTGSHKTGLFGWGGEKADYSSLLKTYPALIDGQGKLNKELAQSILDNKTLDDTSKKALQSALDYSKEYEDALKSLSDYLNTVFGSLGQEMMTSITDNLGDTKGALNDFADDSANTIEKLMTNIAYSMFFADKFKAMSDKALAIQKDLGLTPEQQAAKQTELLGQFYSNVGNDIDSANKFLADSKDAAAKYGFDLWNTTTREATTKGFASMSQESSNELNGRFTHMDGTMTEVSTNTLRIADSMDLLKANSSSILENVIEIKGHTSRLEAIENGIGSMKMSLDTINTKGINIKVG